MHLDEETIQRLLDGELDPAAQAAARAHLPACPGCRDRLAETEREEARMRELLGRLDGAPAAADPEAALARARGGRPEWLRRAAVVAFAVAAAGAAYALPGSPVRGWIARWTGGGEPPAVKESAASGVSVPAGERFTIRFEAAQARGAVTVTVTDRADVLVRALGGAPRFTSDPERLTVANAGSAADYEVELPRTAPQVEILVGERTVFRKLGTRVETAGPDTGGAYRLPLTE
jgi:anti-sigma factor RsiW